MSLARKNIFQDKTRFALSTACVSLAIMLILVLNGLLNGVYLQASSYLDHAPGSVMVTQSGVKNALSGSSLLPPGTLEKVRQAEGVGQVIPVVLQAVILELHQKKVFVFLVGYDEASGGGPWKLVQGHEPEQEEEAVLDRVQAEQHNLKLGDNFEILGNRFKISGFSEGSLTWMTSFVFIRKTAAEKLLQVPGATSFLFVNPGKEVQPRTLQARLQSLPLAGTEVLLKSEVSENDRQLFTKAFTAPLVLMVWIAFLVGSLIVGLVIYTSTLERQREYGVLKAIGAPNRLLYRVVTTQALMAAGTGALTGVGLAWLAARLIETIRPQFTVALEPLAVVQALLLGVGMALLAALVPVRFVTRLAPAEIFRK
ncbi:MAG TPA: ABC transporter permease [Chloroflexia bacterium]|nr:ABC transporter permease [Chloroflexia bacterium]